ncbi:MAG: hypothetical protein WCQ96_03090 [Patescibacteria group bacterium]
MIFSDTARAVPGIIQKIEDFTGTRSATADSYSLSSKVADVNFALAKLNSLKVENSGTTLFDDYNQTDYPVITFDLEANKQEYNITQDGATIPNIIQNIYRVSAADENGTFSVLNPVDVLKLPQDMSEYQKQAGVPTEFALMANGIHLFPAPSYDYKEAVKGEGGLKIYSSRTPVYYLVTDTTKVSGLPADEEYFLIFYPAYFYWLGKDNAKAAIYERELLKIEEKIKNTANRNKARGNNITMRPINAI